MKSELINKRSNSIVFIFYLRKTLLAYIKSPIKLTLAFISLFLMINVWLMVKQGDDFLIASCVCVLLARATCQVGFLQVKEFKESCMHERIRYTSNTKFAYAGILLANFILSFSQIILIFINASAYSTQRILIHQMNWKIFILSIFMLWFLFASFNLYLVSLSTNLLVIYLFTVAVYVMVVYFLGCAYPYYIIKEYKWMDIILYAFPPRYLVNIAQASFVNANNLHYVSLDGNIDFDFGIGNSYWIGFAVSIFLIVSVVTLTLFKNRKFINLEFKNNSLTNPYIVAKNSYKERINNATTKKEIDNLFNELKNNYKLIKNKK